VAVILFLAVRGFAQVFNQRGSGRIRVTNVWGKEFWMPPWWRTFTMVSAVAMGIAALAFLAIVIFS